MKCHNGGHFLLRVGGRERPFPHARWLSYAAETAQCCGAWSDCHQPTYFCWVSNSALLFHSVLALQLCWLFGREPFLQWCGFCGVSEPLTFVLIGQWGNRTNGL